MNQGRELESISWEPKFYSLVGQIPQVRLKMCRKISLVLFQFVFILLKNKQ